MQREKSSWRCLCPRMQRRPQVLFSLRRQAPETAFVDTGGFGFGGRGYRLPPRCRSARDEQAAKSLVGDSDEAVAVIPAAIGDSQRLYQAVAMMSTGCFWGQA